MKDNLSIVITMIVFVILIVIFPLYNYFERQDDMSYNMVLKATTNFVDEVINCGYIDQDMYNKFVNKLAVTGNLYDIQLEAHKKFYTTDVFNKNNDEFIEQYEIDYNDDIFEMNTGNLKNGNVKNIDQKVLKRGVYHLNSGDQIYARVKNTNTTMAGAIFSIIVPTSSTKRVTVNYGGIVKNNAWKNLEISNLMTEDIFVEIKLNTTDSNGFDIASNSIEAKRGNSLVYDVKVLNYDKNVSTDDITAKLRDIKLIGFKENKSLNPYNVEKVNNSWKVIFSLDGVNQDYIEDTQVTVSAELPSDKIQGNYYKNVTTKSDKEVIVTRNNIDLNQISFNGPYISGGSSIVNKITFGEDIIFFLNYGNNKINLTSDEIDAKNFIYEEKKIYNDIDRKRYKIEFTKSYTLNFVDKHLISYKDIKSEEFAFEAFTAEYKTPNIYNLDVPAPGRYMLKVVGANGSSFIKNNPLTKPGKGGVTIGFIDLTTDDRLAIIVGGTSVCEFDNVENYGFNGGGKGFYNTVNGNVGCRWWRSI